MCAYIHTQHDTTLGCGASWHSGSEVWRWDYPTTSCLGLQLQRHRQRFEPYEMKFKWTISNCCCRRDRLRALIVAALHPGPARRPAALEEFYMCRATSRESPQARGDRAPSTGREPSSQNRLGRGCERLQCHVSHGEGTQQGSPCFHRHTAQADAHTCTCTCTHTEPEDAMHSGPPSQPLAVRPLGSRPKQVEMKHFSWLTWKPTWDWRGFELEHCLFACFTGEISTLF